MFGINWRMTYSIAALNLVGFSGTILCCVWVSVRVDGPFSSSLGSQGFCINADVAAKYCNYKVRQRIEGFLPHCQIVNNSRILRER